MAAVDPELKAQLMQVFTMLDRNGSMQIDQREVGYLLNKLLGRQVDEMTLSEIMSEICDSDAPGVGIDFESFCKALGPILSGSSEDDLNKRAFEAMCVAAAAFFHRTMTRVFEFFHASRVLRRACRLCSPVASHLRRDADGSGCITAAELAPIMTTVAGAMPESQVNQILQVSAGADGKLRYPDYVKAVSK